MAPKKKKKEKRSTSTKDTATDPNFYSGFGEFTLPNGDMYIGDYCAHRSGLIWRQGHGIYQSQDGQTYEGLWNDDKLMDGKEILITYPNGAKYWGPLLKNKYHGPGTYVLESNMSITCNFVANKPSGMVSLVDRDGMLWRGVAKENSVLLLPENIFYLNLIEDRGKGLSKEPLDISGMHPSTSSCTNENREEDLSDREWEKIIFAKSKITEGDLDFTDCKWWKNYDEFKQKYDEIKTKIDDEISLDNEEYIWIERFKKYKQQQHAKKALKKSKLRQERLRVMALNERFRSKDFIESCPPVNVIYPRDTWEEHKHGKIKKKFSEHKRLESDQLVTSNTNVIIVGSTGKIIDEPEEGLVAPLKPIEIEPPPTTESVESSSSSSSANMQFGTTAHPSDQNGPRTNVDHKSYVYGRVSKNLIPPVENEELELHFTELRQEMLLEKRNELKAAAEDADRMSTKRSMSKPEQDSRMSKQESKMKKSDMTVLKCETESENKFQNQMSEVIETKKEKREERIWACVQAMVAKRQEKSVEKRRDSIKPEKDVHTHDIGTHTESITGIPRDALLHK